MNADPNLQIIMSPQKAQLLNGSELGDTPMTYACYPGLGDDSPLPVSNRLTCLSLLIRNGASVDKIGPAGWPPLVMSCVAGIGGAPYEETALLLLKHGADISICPELRGKKTSLLSWAVAAGYPNVVRKLCEAGYDPNFRGEMSPPPSLPEPAYSGHRSPDNPNTDSIRSGRQCRHARGHGAARFRRRHSPPEPVPPAECH